MRRKNVVLCFLVFLFSCFFDASVFAQPSKRDLQLSRQYNKEGAELYKKGQFIEAADKFVLAYKAHSNSDAAANAALAYEMARDYTNAIHWYEIYITDATDLDNPSVVREKIGQLQTLLKVDEEKRAEEEKRRSEEEEKRRKEEEEKQVKIEDEVLPDSLPNNTTVIIKPIESSRPYRIWKWVGTGATFSLLITGITFESMGRGQAGDANRIDISTPEDYKKYQSEYASARSKMITSYVFYGAAGAAAIGSGVFWYLDWRDTRKPEIKKSVEIVPFFDSNAGGAAIFRRF